MCAGTHLTQTEMNVVNLCTAAPRQKL